jgi:hypothetical protein
MPTISNMLKTAAVAGVLGLVAVAGSAAPAAAHTYTRCDYDGDRCVRIQCDWDGDDCWRASQYSQSPYYYGGGRWVCDADGDDCRWTYGRRDYGDGYSGNYGRNNDDGYYNRSYERRDYDDDYYDGSDALSFGYHN